MVDQETLDAIALMFEGFEERLDRKLEKMEIRMEERLEAKLEEKLEEKLEAKLKPIRTDILTLYGEVHGLKNEMADVRDDIHGLRMEVEAVKKQTVYNYDKIIDNYAAVRELKTIVEEMADKPVYI